MTDRDNIIRETATRLFDVWKRTMPTFRVIITRDVTESTVVEVEAESEEMAETAALAKLHASTDTEWEIDEGSWNQGDACVTGVDRVSG